MVRTKRPQWQPLAWRSGAVERDADGGGSDGGDLHGGVRRIVTRAPPGLSSPPVSPPRDEPRDRPDATLPPGHGPLPAWNVAELEAPPPFTFRNALKVIGPGAIMAATSIGGGEWLVGPAAAVKYSSQIFLIATVAIALQVDLQPGGDPLHALHGRADPRPASCASRPGPRFWAGFYTVLGFFQLGWPALAGSAAATLLGAWIGRMPGRRGPGDARLDRDAR